MSAVTKSSFSSWGYLLEQKSHDKEEFDCNATVDTTCTTVTTKWNNRSGVMTTQKPTIKDYLGSRSDEEIRAFQRDHAMYLRTIRPTVLEGDLFLHLLPDGAATDTFLQMFVDFLTYEGERRGDTVRGHTVRDVVTNVGVGTSSDELSSLEVPVIEGGSGQAATESPVMDGNSGQVATNTNRDDPMSGSVGTFPMSDATETTPSLNPDSTTI
jgi:hypothetical protein